MQLSPLQKMSVTVGAALVVLGLFAGVAYYYASRLVAADRAVERANMSMAEAFRVVVSRQDAERATKAYVVRPDSAARASLQDAQRRVEDALDAMGRSTEDHPRQRQLLGELGRRAAASFESYRTAVLIRDRAGLDSAKRYLSGEIPASAADSLMGIVTQMRDEELRVLAESTRLQSAHGANAQRLILVGMILTFLLAGVALQPMRAEIASRITSHLVRDHVANAPELAEAATAAAAATSAHLHALQHLIADLEGTRDAASAARALVAVAGPALQTAIASVIVPNGAGGFSVLAATSSTFDAVSPELARPVADTLRTGEAAMAESRAERDRLWGSLAVLDTAGARGAALFVPLRREGAVNGVLVIALAADHVFGDDELVFAATLGRLGGPAVAARLLTS
ncbi:MAG: CHASE3 domain-containing protein [Gemmatimonadota bacterium]|nr:CHASE3 domain-containing protein [Gemmatimonadota bacterium]